jgi:CHAT domain-containing protein/tetratricopeptide (TPR) repeat protein
MHVCVGTLTLAGTDGAAAGPKASGLQSATPGKPEDPLSAMLRESELLQERGQLSEAERVARICVSLATEGGPNQVESLLTAQTRLADVLEAQERYAEAIPLFQSVFDGWSSRHGKQDRRTLHAQANLATIHNYSGQFTESEALSRDGLRDAGNAFGPDDPLTLRFQNQLANTLSSAGEFKEAEQLFRDLNERLRRFGDDSEDSLESVNDFANLLLQMGRYGEAEALNRRALEGMERILGPEHPDTLRALNDLATVFEGQGRYNEALTIYQRVLPIRERISGPDDPETIIIVNNLANVYDRLLMPTEAEQLYRRAVETETRVFGADHPETLVDRNNLAVFFRKQGRLTEAEEAYRGVLAARERVLGPDHHDTLTSVYGLGMTLSALGRKAEAETMLQRVVLRRQERLGAEHPNTINAAAELTSVLIEGGKGKEALETSRGMLDGLRGRRSHSADTRLQQAQQARERGLAGPRFSLLADALWAAEPSPDGEESAEAFLALQEAVSGPATESMTQGALRRYAEQQGAALGALVRERQTLQQAWTGIVEEISAVTGDAEAVQTRDDLRRQLKALEEKLDTIEGTLRQEFPDYFSLIVPQPVAVLEAQQLLAGDEAILLVVPSRHGTHSVVVTRAAIRWSRSDLNSDRVALLVQRLRWDLGARVAVSEEVAAEWGAGAASRLRPAFDRRTAFELHKQLIAPLLPALTGVKHLYVAAGGSLAGLPFSVLVTQEPRGADDDPSSLRATRWLGDDFALTHIPSVQSLSRLRAGLRPASNLGGTFLGFGDPLLEGPAATRSRRSGTDQPGADDIFSAAVTRGGPLLADLAEIRRMSRLPGTAAELEAVRNALGAPKTSLRLGRAATEPSVRQSDLSAAEFILFSTHGLTAEEATGLGEPGLVLTPPSEATESDDGYLSASEVAALRLNAAWVILSACNTATGEGAEGQGLSGLARAFFYAGARNLLASHWPVSDEAAPTLITRTVELQRAGASRAEALQRAMREVRMNTSRDVPTDTWAHPFYWAPFVLIGDGRD